jgi:hypothetical protein
MASPNVTCEREGLAGARGFQQNIAQPGGIAPLEMKGLAKYPRLVPASRVRRVQAIVFNFTDIEDRLIGCAADAPS